MTDKRTKVAIFGYTEHKSRGPWKDPDWDIWSLNDHYGDKRYFTDELFKSGRVSWFQLHRRDAGENPFHAGDPKHLEWLQKAPCPVYMWDTDDDIPNAVKYPLHEVLAAFKYKYLNNTISEMVALAMRTRIAKVANSHWIQLVGRRLWRPNGSSFMIRLMRADRSRM